MFELEDDKEGTPGSLTMNGDLVPPSYIVVLYPDSGEADDSAPQLA